MKLTNRIYLDYNATSPLAASVTDYLDKGDFFYANPSSVHSSGKKSKRAINRVKDFLYQLFDLDPDQWDLFFHSGASEAINHFFLAHCFKGFDQTAKSYFLVGATDHSASYCQIERAQHLSHFADEYKVNQNGEIDWSDLAAKSKNFQQKSFRPGFINYCWVNNETGVVWDLEDVKKIKSFAPDAFIHVDAVQAVGKIANWRELSQDADAYTFSGHKFGAFKGSGFSFVKKSSNLLPLICGGGQQNNLRSGTENPDGIYSLFLSLKELSQQQNFQELSESMEYLEQQLRQDFSDQLLIVGQNAKKRSLRTINFISKKEKADIVMTAFDLAGIDVSSGSACSSGSIAPSRVLLAMGQSQEMAQSSIRLSFGPYFNLEQAREIYPKLTQILQRFC